MNLWGHNVGAAAKLIYHSVYRRGRKKRTVQCVLRSSSASELSGVFASWLEVDMRYGISDMPATENHEEEKERKEDTRKESGSSLQGQESYNRRQEVNSRTLTVSQP